MIVVVGLSHRTAPVEVRERFGTSEDALARVLSRLAQRPELAEVMFLSTCNRVEVLAVPSSDGKDRDRALALSAIRSVMAENGKVSEGELLNVTYTHEGEEAIRHVFRVAASLDSMVLGEPQILGQVKNAYDAAVAAGSLKGYLQRCMQRAFAVAKRVRTETALGEGSVSISSVAVDLARHILGNLEKCNVLLLGAGEMGEAAAKSLGKSAKSVRVCNRSIERATALAQSIGGSPASWSALEAELATADVVVVSTSSPTYVITPEIMKRVAKARRGRTLFFVDIAVPRQVDPELHGNDNVYVFDIDDLEEQVARGLETRKSEAEAAERIVAGELERFLEWSRGLDVQPAIVALRAKTHAVLVSELERSLGTRLKHLGEADRAALTQMIDSATNKLLHAPVTRLRAAASSDGGADLVKTIRDLFDLPGEQESASEEDDDEQLVQ